MTNNNTFEKIKVTLNEISNIFSFRFIVLLTGVTLIRKMNAISLHYLIKELARNSMQY